MALIPRIRAGITAVHTATAPTNDLGTGTGATITLGELQLLDFSLSDGTAVGQADRIFSDTRTVNASTNDDLDLNAGTITDSFGVVVSFVKIKGIYVRSATANTQTFTVGAAAANGLTTAFAAAAVVLRPGGALLLACGSTDNTAYGVTPATADLLRVANGAGAAINYDIVIIGTSV